MFSEPHSKYISMQCVSLVGRRTGSRRRGGRCRGFRCGGFGLVILLLVFILCLFILVFFFLGLLFLFLLLLLSFFPLLFNLGNLLCTQPEFLRTSSGHSVSALTHLGGEAGISQMTVTSVDEIYGVDRGKDCGGRLVADVAGLGRAYCLQSTDRYRSRLS